MPKSVRRLRRSSANAQGSDAPSLDAAHPPGDTPARRPTRADARPLERILDTPHLARIVPHLQPELLHRIIQQCGLEESGDLVALATPDQLTRLLDLDVWRAGRPGLDERLDPDRFGRWIEVLVESGAGVAARKIAEIDFALVSAGLAFHALVFDRAAVAPYTTLLGDEVAARRVPAEALACDIGEYLVVAKGTDSWEAIVSLLTSLEAEHRDYFHRVMHRCRKLSNSRPEADGFHDLLADQEQVLFDLASDRDRRREQQGYVEPAQARAFLEMSRQLRLDHGPMPPANPIARAHFRAVDESTPVPRDDAATRLPGEPDAEGSPEPAREAIDAVVEILRGTGVVAPQSRALLREFHGEATRLGRILAHMQFLGDRNQAAYSKRNEELAYLANALVAGCSIQCRCFTAQEAWDGAVAVCNLGLENWPAGWRPGNAGTGRREIERGIVLPADFLVHHDLVTVFQVGWKVLHEGVSLYAAERLLGVLADLRSHDREIQAGIRGLRIELSAHWRAGAPWRARDALEAIAMLDLPAWAALLALLDECPVLHAVVDSMHRPRARAVAASAFEFISENSQIALVREFMESLPARLGR